MTSAKPPNGNRTGKTPAAGITVKRVAPANGVEPVRTTRASARAEATAKAKSIADAEALKPKPKLVRDSFTIPKSEYAVLDALKLRAARLMRPTKKSEVLRAGIAALDAMDDAAFLEAVNGVPSLKTGRPKSTPAPVTAAVPKAAAK